MEQRYLREIAQRNEHLFPMMRQRGQEYVLEFGRLGQTIFDREGTAQRQYGFEQGRPGFFA
jgi:hypothetical protein